MGDPAGRAPHPYLRGATREANAHDLIFGCWTADVWPFGQIGFSIWTQFLFEQILFLPPPSLMPGWKQGSLPSSHGQLAGCELGHWGPETVLLVNLTLERECDLMKLCSLKLTSTIYPVGSF